MLERSLRDALDGGDLIPRHTPLAGESGARYSDALEEGNLRVKRPALGRNVVVWGSPPIAQHLCTVWRPISDALKHPNPA
jgi:hypothetical protein